MTDKTVLPAPTDDRVLLAAVEPVVHGPGCGCTRCVGFQTGNTIGLRHGAYSRLALAARAAEHADTIRSLVPAAADGDDYAIAGLALIAVRLEAASVALERLDGYDSLGQYRDGVRERVRLDVRPLGVRVSGAIVDNAPREEARA